MSECDAIDYRVRARNYLREAQAATNLTQRQELINQCEQELIAAAAARMAELGTMTTDMRKVSRR